MGRISAAQRQANDQRIRTVMDRLLRGELPPGGRCDVKTLAAESGLDRTAFYGTRPYARLRVEFEQRLAALQQAGERPDPREAQLTRLKQMSYRGFLAELLMAECDDRARRRSERRIKAAAFPRTKSLREFDFDAKPNVDPAVVHTLASCEWVRKGLPLCLIGDSGTGKSHLLIALGTEAAMAGHRVLMWNLVCEVSDRFILREIQAVLGAPRTRLQERGQSCQQLLAAGACSCTCTRSATTRSLFAVWTNGV